jgi:tyrosyl-tRNA synthetase
MDKKELITRNLEEIFGETKLNEFIEQKKTIKAYWGTAPTGRIHIGYLVPMVKIADLLMAGCEVTILIADLHAHLDAMKSSFDQLKSRSKYYEMTIIALLSSIGSLMKVDNIVEKLKFVRGTDLQMNNKYTLDMYRLSAIVTERNAIKAGTNTVKQEKNIKLGSMLYPLLQALDEEYLDVDLQLGGIDQRKIFTFAESYLPKLGYRKRIHLMNPLIPNLLDPKEKMSASDNSKIDVISTEKSMRKKIGKAFCEEGKVEENGLLKFVKLVVFPVFRIFEIKRDDKYGGDISFDSYDELELAFLEKRFHPIDLKMGVCGHLNTILAPIRKLEIEELLQASY